MTWSCRTGKPTDASLLATYRMDVLHLFLLHEAREEHVPRPLAHELQGIFQLALVGGLRVRACIFKQINDLHCNAL